MEKHAAYERYSTTERECDKVVPFVLLYGVERTPAVVSEDDSQEEDVGWIAMRKSCAAKADSCNGSAKVPVTRCMVGAVSIGLGLAAAGTGASVNSRSGSSLRWASAARSRGMLAVGCASILDAHRGPTAGQPSRRRPSGKSGFGVRTQYGNLQMGC